MVEGLARVEWRVDVNALDLLSKVLLQSLEGKKVITEDEHVLGVGIAVGLRRVFNQDAGFQSHPLVLADPSEFEFS